MEPDGLHEALHGAEYPSGESSVNLHICIVLLDHGYYFYILVQDFLPDMPGLMTHYQEELPWPEHFSSA